MRAPEQHARYLAAQAARDQAALDLQRTEIHAPANGIITNLTLRPGDYIKTGTPIFSLVETDHLWVEANFKETDLTHVRPGQTAIGDHRHLSRHDLDTTRWAASAPPPAPSSRCCRRRTPAATGSRSCSAFPCGWRSPTGPASRRCAPA